MATDYSTKSVEELVTVQQKLMADRTSAYEKYEDEIKAVQFELDKRAALQRLGTIGDAELAVLDELKAKREAEKAAPAAESEGE